MRFRPTPIEGVALVETDLLADARGQFARLFCAEAFAEAGLHANYPQHSLSVNLCRGTIRGLHFQRPPHEEPKVVRCIAGAVFDVAVDLRAESPTFGRWWGTELDSTAARALVLPPGVGHGFQTLTDAAELLYLIGTPYVASAASGVRWNDPALAITWPLPVSVISERDRALPDLASAAAERAAALQKAAT